MIATLELAASVDGGLPEALPVGRGSSVIWRGTCSFDGGAVRSVRLLVDGVEQELAGIAPGSRGADQTTRWWAIADFPQIDAPHEATIELRARVGRREHATAQLGAVELQPGWSPPRLNYKAAAERTDGSITGALSLRPRVVICMSTRSPDLALLRARIESLKAQTYGNWTAVVSDASASSHHEKIDEMLDHRPRFALHRASGLTAYEGYEQALMRVPTIAPFIVLTDLEDDWQPTALQSLLDALEPETNACVLEIDADSRAEAPAEPLRHRTRNEGSWAVSRQPGEGPILFRRPLLDYLLPFPPAPSGWTRPNRWVALVASATALLSRAPAQAASRTRSGDETNRLTDIATARVLAARCGGYLASRERRQLQRLASAD